MKLIEFLFTDYDQKAKVEQLCPELVKEILNDAEMLNRVPFCFLEKGKSYSPLLKELFQHFDAVFSTLGRSQIERFVLEHYPNRMPFLESEEDDRFVKYLMFLAIRDEVPQLDQYIQYSFNDKEPVWADLFQDSQFDKDGLLAIDDSMDLRPQGLLFSEHRLFYHPFLRRGYNSLNNFHGLTFFIDELRQQGDLNLRVRLDPMRLGRAKDYKDVIECDHWFGPPFSPEKLNDRNYRGLVRYGNSTDPLIGDKYTDRTEFYITNRSDGTKQIEIEELLVENPAIFSKFKPQKYAHMIWDSKSASFIHFDVAIMAYTAEILNLRFHSKWKGQDAEPIKPYIKLKLFRVDGGLTIEQAMTLVAFFFYQNEQIHEFFSGETIKTSI